MARTHPSSVIEARAGRRGCRGCRRRARTSAGFKSVVVVVVVIGERRGKEGRKQKEKSLCLPKGANASSRIESIVMSTTVVRVKRKRDRASMESIVVEYDAESSGAREAEARAHARRRAEALAAALDGVLEGGSSATPYGAYARGGDYYDEEDDVVDARPTRRRKFARVAAGVSSAEDVASALEASRKRERRGDDETDAHGVDDGGMPTAKSRTGYGGAFDPSSVRVYDVMYDSNGNAHSGEDEIKRAMEAEAVLMCNYLPMVREYLGSRDGGPPPFDGEEANGAGSKDSGVSDEDEWVYDYYVMDEAQTTRNGTVTESDDGDEDDGYLPVIRVKDFQDPEGVDDIESDYGDSDSNAEDYFGADYPDTESSYGDDSDGFGRHEEDEYWDDDDEY